MVEHALKIFRKVLHEHRVFNRPSRQIAAPAIKNGLLSEHTTLLDDGNLLVRFWIKELNTPRLHQVEGISIVTLGKQKVALLIASFGHL